MPARSIGSATVSFGLVSIPVRMYVATHSEQPSFNLIHGVCKSRIKQQTWCPRCERVVDQQLELVAAQQRVQHDAGLRPRERAAHAAQVERAPRRAFGCHGDSLLRALVEDNSRLVDPAAAPCFRMEP